MLVTDIYIRHNLHLQIGESNCGPAALLNVLRFEGRDDHSEDELAELCGTDQTGTTNENLVSAAGHVGLEIVDTRTGASLDGPARLLRDGCYVIVNYFCAFSGGGHYAPIIESDESAVYLFDSSYGLFRLSNHEFEPYWHNKNGDVRRWLLAVR